MQLQPTRVHLYSKSACVQARFMCPSVMPIASLEDAESRRYNPFLYAMAYKKGLYLLPWHTKKGYTFCSLHPLKRQWALHLDTWKGYRHMNLQWRSRNGTMDTCTRLLYLDTCTSLGCCTWTHALHLDGGSCIVQVHSETKQTFWE